jgi:hypothetical protein
MKPTSYFLNKKKNHADSFWCSSVVDLQVDTGNKNMYCHDNCYPLFKPILRIVKKTKIEKKSVLFQVFVFQNNGLNFLVRN